MQQLNRKYTGTKKEEKHLYYINEHAYHFLVATLL